MIQATTWMNLKISILYEISQAKNKTKQNTTKENNHTVLFDLCKILENASKSILTEIRTVVV